MRAETSAQSAARSVGPLFDSRWFGDHGIGRFAREVYNRLAGYRTACFSGSPWNASDVFTTSWRLREQRPSFYFTPGYNAPVACPCPFALTVHDLNHLATPGQSTPLKRLYYRAVLKPAIHRAAVTLTVSEFSRAAIVAWAGVAADKVVNVSNGVSPAFRRDGPVYQTGTKPYLLGIASAKQHKNQDGLLSGYAASRSRRDFDLLLLGSNNPSAQETLARLGIGDSVRFLGRLNDEDFASVYRGATGFLFVSRYEGFGLPIVEAMACGTPVITAGVSAMPEVAAGAAMLVDPLQPLQLGAAIDRLCSSAGLRAELRERGFLRAAQFSWDDTGQRVRDALAPYH